MKYPKFIHTQYSIFTEELFNFIKENRIDEIYLSGIYTDVSIIKAAMDAFDMNIKVKVVSDACASLHGENNHRYALDSLKHIIGKDNIVTVSEVARKNVSLL